MSITVVPIEYGVIDLMATRRANRHPEWCSGLLSCATHHTGRAVSGRSWYRHNEKPELRWTLEAKQSIAADEARVEALLYFNNRHTDEGLPAFALFDCTAGDARAMAADLLKIAEQIDASEVSR